MQPFFTGGRCPCGGQSPGEGSATVAAESTEGRRAQADRCCPLRKADLPPKRKGGSNVCVPYLLPLDLEGLPVNPASTPGSFLRFAPATSPFSASASGTQREVRRPRRRVGRDDLPRFDTGGRGTECSDSSASSRTLLSRARAFRPPSEPPLRTSSGVSVLADE